jgi:hypothetical protein
MQPNEPNRKRIVINLDQPPGANPGAQRKKRRWPKILAAFILIVCAGVVLAAVGGLLWWRHYQTTPSYSLALVVDAAQRNDMAAVDNQLDQDEIVKNALTIFRQRAESRYGAALSGPLRLQIDNLQPVLLPRLKQTVHDELAKEIQEFSAQSEPKPFLLVALTLPSLANISTEGDNAKVTATLKNRVIDLTMRRDGERWKVTSLNDGALTDRAIDDLMKELPAIGQFDPPDTRKKPKTPRRR